MREPGLTRTECSLCTHEESKAGRNPGGHFAEVVTAADMQGSSELGRAQKNECEHKVGKITNSLPPKKETQGNRYKRHNIRL